MATAEGTLLALEKQNEHRHVLGIKGNRISIREVCLIPLSMHNLQIIYVFIFFLPHIG